MPKIIRSLTRKAIEATPKKATSKRPEKRNDGNNLSLLVYLTGKRTWQTRYNLNGKYVEWRFADYSECDEKQARGKNSDFQKLAKQGIDPKIVNNADKETQKLTFQSIAIEALERRKLENKKDHENERRLNKHVFPIIGNMPHHEITKQIMQEGIFDPLIKKGILAEAKKTKDAIKLVFEYAINQYEKIDINPTDRLFLPAYKPKPFHAITDENLLKPFLVDLWAYRENHPRASVQVEGLLKLSMMFFLRPSEIRCLKWSDYDESEQIIHAYSSKVDVKHPILIPRQATEVLQYLKEHKRPNNDYIFATNRNTNDPLSEGACRVALKKMGYQGKQTMHGIRATARTIADEELGLAVIYLESQLTHQSKDPNKGSYNRSSYKRQRGIILQKWADYMEALRLDGDVEKVKFDYEEKPIDTLKILMKLISKEEVLQILEGS